MFDEVMASLDASEKAHRWSERVAYNRERMETHGAAPRSRDGRIGQNVARARRRAGDDRAARSSCSARRRRSKDKRSEAA